MSIVDQVKAVRPTLYDFLMPQRFVFHHVPKCGGTSVGRALRQKYILSQATVTPESSFRAFESFSGRTDREQMLIDVLDLREQMMLYHMYEDVRGVSLHVRFSELAYEKFKGKYKFVTLLREPVSRFISHYFWSYGKPNAHARIEEDFADFLTTQRAKRLGATYVEYYSGLPARGDITSQKGIISAIENLRKFDVVGRLDDVPSFERMLRNELGVRVKIGHQNKMRQPISKKDEIVTPKMKEKVIELCAPDLAVWESIQKR